MFRPLKAVAAPLRDLVTTRADYNAEIVDAEEVAWTSRLANDADRFDEARAWSLGRRDAMTLIYPTIKHDRRGFTRETILDRLMGIQAGQT